MSKNQQKNVSNLLNKLAKARDVVTGGDFEEIYKHIYLFNQLEEEIRRQVAKYMRHSSHELDFTFQDLKEFSDEIYEYLKEFQKVFLYDNQFEKILEMAPLDDAKMNEYATIIRRKMDVDDCLHYLLKSIAYLAIVTRLWSDTDYKKPLGDQLASLVRSFI